METIVRKSNELEAFKFLGTKKVDAISKENLLPIITNIPGVTAEGLDWEISKKAVSLKIILDRPDSTETLHWQIKRK